MLVLSFILIDTTKSATDYLSEFMKMRKIFMNERQMKTLLIVRNPFFAHIVCKSGILRQGKQRRVTNSCDISAYQI